MARKLIVTTRIRAASAALALVAVSVAEASAGQRQPLGTTEVRLATIRTVVTADADLQPLPRRSFFGAQLALAPAGSTTRGVLLQNVFPGHAADGAGLRQGDIVVSVNGDAVTTVEEMLAHLRGRPVGHRLDVRYVRVGTAGHANVVLAEMPRERHAGVDVIYDELEVDGSRRRTILTRPTGASVPLPTVLMVGGIGCYSLDVPIGELDGYPRILTELSRRGYATMRIEKRGVGDSEGAPCSEQSFTEELAAYVAAARAVRRYPFVDGARVFLFGHSIGGLHAPLIEAAVAGDAPLAGLMVKGTVGTSWFAYEMENFRRQAPIWGTADEQVEARALARGLCLAAVTVAGRTPAEVLAERPDCASTLQFPAHHSYRRELVDLDLAGSWRQVRAPVLAIYGTSDFLTSAAEHHFIAGILNRQRPGQATVAIVDDMDHYFRNVASYIESARVAQGQATAAFDERIHDVLVEWMEKVGRG